MRPLLLLALVACTPPARDPNTVRDLERAVIVAADARDAPTLARLLDDRFVIAFQREPGGAPEFSDKTRSIARWTRVEPGVEPRPTLLEDVRVVANGDTAVVYARITDRWRDAEGEHEAKNAVLDVWSWRDGRWTWLASSESPIR